MSSEGDIIKSTISKNLSVSGGEKARAFLPTEIGGSLHQKQASTAPSQRFEGISTQPHAAEMTKVISRQEVEMCKMTAVTAAHESLTADSRAAAVQAPAAEVDENDREQETIAIAASTHGRAFEMFCILHGDKVCVNEIDRERVWEHVCMLCEYVGKYIHVVATCMFVCMYVCLLVRLFDCLYVCTITL